MKQVSWLKGGFWITCSNFSKRFFALLSNLILARLLMPSEFGVIGIAYVFWSFFTLFTQSSTGLFILYKGTKEKRYLETTYTVSVILGAIMALGLSATAPLIANFFKEPSLRWLLLAYAFNILLSSGYFVYAAILTSQMQYRALATDTMIASIARLVFTIGAALLGLRYWSFAVGDTAYWIVAFVLTRHTSGHHLRLRIDREIMSEVLSYCLGAVGTSFGFYANSNLDNFVVGKLLGSTSLGYYNLAYQLSMALSTILIPVINQIGTPVFAQLPDEQEQKDALFKVTKQVAYITTALYALLFLVIDEQVISLVFGSNWLPITTIIPWLLVSAYFRVINGPLKSMLSAKGLPGINARVNLCIAPVAVLGFIIGAQNGGILGVSLAAALVLGVVWTGYWWWTGCRVLGWPIKQFLVPCIQPILISLPALAVAYLISRPAFAIWSFLPTILKPIIFILLYLISVRLVDPEQFSIYKDIARKLVKRLTSLRKKA